jgi:hypothetical protein
MTTYHPAYDDGVLRITSIGSPASLAIAGDIDGYTYAALLDTLRRLTDGLHEIHINLADVDYCDLAGLRANPPGRAERKPRPGRHPRRPA